MQQKQMTQAQANALLAQMRAQYHHTNTAGGQVHLSTAMNKTITVTPLQRPGMVNVQMIDGCTC